MVALSFGKVCKSVCFLVTAQNSLKWRVIFTEAETRCTQLHHKYTIFECLCQYGILPEKMKKKRGFIVSIHSTKLFYCISCGKAVGLLRGFEQKHIFFLATAAARPCANSQQMCPSPTLPVPISFQLHIYLIISWPHFTANYHHCFVPDQ